MAFDMLINFFIISLQVPSMILIIGEKAYHCALVGVPPQGRGYVMAVMITFTDASEPLLTNYKKAKYTIMSWLIQNASPAVLHMQGALYLAAPSDFCTCHHMIILG